MTVDFNQIQEIHTGGYQISAVWKNGELLWTESPTRGLLTYVPNKEYVNPRRTVTFNSNSGAQSKTIAMTAPCGKAFTLNPLPQDWDRTSDWYDFVGWSTNSAAISAEYEDRARVNFDHDITLYAVWHDGATYAEYRDSTPRKRLLIDGEIGSPSIYNSGYARRIEIGSRVLGIVNGGFWAQNQIEDVIIGNGIQRIGDSAFNFCDGLLSVTIPGSVSSVGDMAFCNCSRLRNVTLENGLNGVGEMMFAGCHKLTDITIPGSVISIGDCAFGICESLSSVTIENGVESIGDVAFIDCSSLTDLTIPSSVTSIGERALSGCTMLTNLYFPESTLPEIQMSANYPWGLDDESVIRGKAESASTWQNLVATLESGQYSDNSPATFRDVECAPGAVISGITYKVDDSSTLSNMQWLVLGYNASIPHYVKYRRRVNGDYQYRWVSSLREPGAFSHKKYGLLGQIAAGDRTYTRTYNPDTGDYDYAAAEAITEVSERTFTYGNNCPYSVPIQITTSEGVFDFAGYNLTILPQSTTDSAFFKFFGDRDRYGTSTIRGALNDISSTAPGGFNDLRSAAYRMSAEPGFLPSVAKTVNRTWTTQQNRHLTSDFSIDGNYCEHIVDKFWLLGAGNVNCLSGEDGWWLYDSIYDTSKFNKVFSACTADLYPGGERDENKVKRQMGADGAPTGVECTYWLRSALYYPGAQDEGTWTTFITSGGKGVAYRPMNWQYSLVPAATIG